MLAIGFMTLSMNSEEGYLTEVAKRASANHTKCYRFIPSRIEPITELVHGKEYDHDKQCWIDSEFPIPVVIYDRCFYGDDSHSKQCIPIVTWLKNRPDITFLGYGLPNKMEIYNTLSTTDIAAYLPHSQHVISVNDITTYLHQHSRIILKPINGSQGYGIYYIEKKNNGFLVKIEKQENVLSRTFSDVAKFQQWQEQLFLKRNYLVQPFLELSDSKSKPFDIRIFLQKNEVGMWLVRGKGIRIGMEEGILSNLSAGGSVIDFSSWFNSVDHVKKDHIYSELAYILDKLPKLLEQKFLPLFELGIDVGLAKDGSIWILDINSKPGRKVVLSTSPELEETLFTAPLLYGNFIHHTKEERKRHDAKTLFH
jgi:hypothetical protein